MEIPVNIGYRRHSSFKCSLFTAPRFGISAAYDSCIGSGTVLIPLSKMATARPRKRGDVESDATARQCRVIIVCGRTEPSAG
jgi:hypothetical protein